MRHISIQSRFTHCLVDDTHAAQGPSVVAEVILDGWVGHLERESRWAFKCRTGSWKLHFCWIWEWETCKHGIHAFFILLWMYEFEWAARKSKEHMTISSTAGFCDGLHQCSNLDNNRFSMAPLKASALSFPLIWLIGGNWTLCSISSTN